MVGDEDNFANEANSARLHLFFSSLLLFSSSLSLSLSLSLLSYFLLLLRIEKIGASFHFIFELKMFSQLLDISTTRDF